MLPAEFLLDAFMSHPPVIGFRAANVSNPMDSGRLPATLMEWRIP